MLQHSRPAGSRTAICIAALVALLCCLLPISDVAGATPASEAERTMAPGATSSLEREVMVSSERLAGHIVRAYESRQGNPNERSLIRGTAGLDVITVGYNAHNSITGRAGEYVLRASVKIGAHGQPDPARLNAEKIDIYAGTGRNISFPIYTYDALPTVLDGQHAWTVDATIHDGNKNYAYYYTTGTPSTASRKLTTSVFESLSSQALTTLDAALHHADIRPPALPFPAPFVGTE